MNTSLANAHNQHAPLSRGDIGVCKADINYDYRLVLKCTEK